MTREPFIAHSELTNEIYIVVGKEKYCVTGQVIKGCMAIKALEQEPKTGYWILSDEQNKEDVENDNYRFICSECQCSDIHAKGTIVPYCWKCGAKMVESEVEK